MDVERGVMGFEIKNHRGYTLDMIDKRIYYEVAAIKLAWKMNVIIGICKFWVSL